MAADNASLLRELAALREENARLLALAAQQQRALETLSLGERRVRQFAKNLEHVVWVMSLHPLKVIYVNPSFVDVWQMSMEEVYGDPTSWMRRIHPDDRAETMRQFQGWTTGSARRHHESLYRLLYPDGRVRWMRDNATMIEDDNGGAFGAAGIVVDITAQREAEIALRASEARLAAAVESLPFDFWACDEQGRFNMQNSISIARYGDVIGKTAEDLPITPEMKVEARERSRRVRDGEIVNGEFRAPMHGQMQDLHLILAPIREGDRIRGMLGVCIDVTEETRAREKLRLSEERFRVTLKNSPIVVYTTDRDLRYTWIEVPREIIPPEQMLGRRDDEIMPIEDAEPLMAMKRQALESGVGVRRECSFQSTDRRVYYDITAEPLRDPSGAIVGLTVAALDITERRHLGEQLLQARKMESLGRVAGSIAHDFNNLLAAIHGCASLAGLKMPGNSPIQADLQAIRQTVERGAALTRQILSFARKEVVVARLIDVNDLVKQSVEAMRAVISEPVRLTATYADTVVCTRMDPSQLDQVLMNLAVNARDAMPEGGRLEIATSLVNLDTDFAERHADIKAGQYVLITISDTGVGMSKEVQRRVFEPFFTTKGSKGTGLGLATSYGIVKANNGHIWVYSEVGHGSVFKIFLPAVDCPPDPTHREPSDVRGGTETILLVEDDPAIRPIAVQMLALRGYRVLEAANGADALKIARSEPGEIHLLVTDLVMPEIDGQSLARQIVQMRKNIRLLFISGYTASPLAPSDEAGRAQSFLPKPFSPIALSVKVRELLDRK